ncbi:MAG: hypothetical protein ACRCXT_18295 [Paraclostridium sp.]
MKLRKIEILTLEEGSVKEVLEKILKRMEDPEKHAENGKITRPELHRQAIELEMVGVATKDESLITKSSIYELSCRKNVKSFVRHVWSDDIPACEGCKYLKADGTYCFNHDFEVQPHSIACTNKEVEGDAK